MLEATSAWSKAQDPASLLSFVHPACDIKFADTREQLESLCQFNDTKELETQGTDITWTELQEILEVTFFSPSLLIYHIERVKVEWRTRKWEPKCYDKQVSASLYKQPFEKLKLAVSAPSSAPPIGILDAAKGHFFFMNTSFI